MASTKPKQLTSNYRQSIAQQIIEDKYPNFNPLVSLAEMALDEHMKPEIRLGALKEVAQYLYPKLKSTEIKMEDDTPSRFTGVKLNVVRADPVTH